VETIGKAWARYRQRKTKRGIVIDISFLVVFLLIAITPIRRGLLTYVLRTTISDPPAYEKVVYVSSSDSISLRSASGQDTTISLPPAHLLLLNRGSIWSPQTRAEMKSLECLRRVMNDDMLIYFITSDDKADVERYFRRKDYHLPTLYVDDLPEEQETGNAVIDELMMSTPGTLIIDRSGRVRVKKMGAAKWDSDEFIERLRSILGEDSFH
jgi:hypothetical protein